MLSPDVVHLTEPSQFDSGEQGVHCGPKVPGGQLEQALSDVVVQVTEPRQPETGEHCEHVGP